MTKGYFIAHVDVSDAEGYESYQAASADEFQKYGGKFFEWQALGKTCAA